MSAINITTDDILYAERILLKEGKNFDDERINFISNLETVDLQAVPGSGKTTALLAKLLILERHLPLKNHRGILILSHTNSAVDEIREKIGKHCPKLFSYPNFIGTIQSFVDKFLAMPYMVNYLGYKITRVDTDTFKEQLLNEFNKIYWDITFDKPGALFYSRHIAESKKIATKTGLNANDICNHKIEHEVRDLFFDFSDNKIKLFRNSSVLLASPDNKRYVGIKSAILKVLENGFISYEYAYRMGLNCIDIYPKMKQILQERFNYVFVDEMQDMDQLQYELLEKVFYGSGESKTIYQRIGDRNQAIYNGDISLENIWKNREKTLNLNGSHRLSKSVAEVVDCLALYRDANFEVNGLFESNIKPHIIVFSNESIKNVIPAYSLIIKNCLDSEQIPKDGRNLYKVIGWVKTKKDNPDKLTISDYCENYSSNLSKQKIDYPTLESYLLYYDTEKRTLESIRKNILNSFIKILRLENIINLETNRYYTKKEMLDFISFYDRERFLELKLKLFIWSMDIIRGKFAEVSTSIKMYIPTLLTFFGRSRNLSSNFIDIPAPPVGVGNKKQEVLANPNVVNYNEINIDISTVHAAKGQTHTATLYLETFYDKGKGNYESERLADQFKYKFFDNNTIDVVKQTAKMAYVGFSRPTHLLCVAIHRDRFDKELADIDPEKWEIVKI